MKSISLVLSAVATHTIAAVASPLIIEWGNTTETIELEPRQGPPGGGGNNQRVNAIWTNRGTESIGLGGGQDNQIAINSGFTLVTEDNQVIWSKSAPDGYSPCQAGSGSSFKLTKGCLGTREYTFNCIGDWTLDIDSCEVKEGSAGSLGKGVGQGKNTYYGIGVAQEHTCGVGFILENEIHCGESKDIQDCCHFNP